MTETEITRMNDENMRDNEPQQIEEVEGVFYFDRLIDGVKLGQFTSSTSLAYAMGWQDNVIKQDDTEQAWDGCTYLKGNAPVKPVNLGYRAEIASLKQQLADSDYKAIKFAEGELTAEEYAEAREQRRAWRARINELEELL